MCSFRMNGSFLLPGEFAPVRFTQFEVRRKPDHCPLQASLNVTAHCLSRHVGIATAQPTDKLFVRPVQGYQVGTGLNAQPGRRERMRLFNGESQCRTAGAFRNSVMELFV